MMREKKSVSGDVAALLDTIDTVTNVFFSHCFKGIVSSDFDGIFMIYRTVYTVEVRQVLHHILFF
jgi:hypothetical protein